MNQNNRAILNERCTPLFAHLDDDDDFPTKRSKEEERKVEKLFDHDDWVQFRSQEKKMDILQDVTLPMLVLVVLYAWFVAIAI